MTRQLPIARRLGQVAILAAALSSVFTQAQSAYERAFPQSKATIDKALKAIQGNLAGRLPTLDGFAKPGEQLLDRYQRGYYQSAVEVIPNRSGGSVVRVTTKVTAWYTDPAGAHSGYQLLTSNGRLEADLLDQLADEVGKGTSETEVRTATAVPSPASVPAASPSAPSPAPTQPRPMVSATVPPPTAAASKPTVEAKKNAGPAVSGVNANVARTFPTSPAARMPPPPPPSSAPTPEQLRIEKGDTALEAEATSLEEVLKNTAHPRNLVAVKKSGTPVVATPSLTAKAQFLASEHDEFELLDFNADWVHVRISGISRGWIWRNSVEMPEGIADTEVHTASQAASADLFHVIREETAPFPGDWEPLRSKTVTIISVQKVDEASKDAGPKDRLEYAKYLLEKTYKEIPKNDQQLQGIVVIFDSADGGMIAATAATLQQWVAGTLSDAALWHNCFFDPPETFDSAGASGSK